MLLAKTKLDRIEGLIFESLTDSSWWNGIETIVDFDEIFWLNQKHIKEGN